MQAQIKVQDDDRIEDENFNTIISNSSAVINFTPQTGKTSFDTQVQLCKQHIINQHQISQSDLYRRLSKFFEYSTKIKPGNEYFTVRKEGNQKSELIENQLIIFGCDFKRLKQVKQEYMPSQSVIINPSNFKLIYPDQGSAWKAIEANARHPEVLAKKRQSEDDPLPRCWIEMKPYQFHKKQIKVFVRYATQEQRSIEQSKQILSDIYNKCRKIYNCQQEQRETKKFIDAYRKRQRIERKTNNQQNDVQISQRQKQLNSSFLYEHYNSINENQWNKGVNQNPGAHKNDNRKANSHSRSRSKGRTNKEGEVIQNINAKQRVAQLNHYMNKMRIDDKNSISSASLEMIEPEYNWNGKGVQPSKRYKWSYSQYIENVERQEEMLRLQRLSKIEVITLDD